MTATKSNKLAVKVDPKSAAKQALSDISAADDAAFKIELNDPSEPEQVAA